MSQELIENLQNPALFDYPVNHFRVIQTHSSYVLLTGSIAYKIKKPVDFGFLDFSTLEKRKHYCQLEFDINRKLAPSLYQKVIKITGTVQKPILNGTGEAIEYAIQMREFPQANLLSNLLAQNKLTLRIVDAIAYRLAQFHQQAARTRPEMEYGLPEQVHKPVKQNFDQIRPLLTDPLDLEELSKIESWSNKQLEEYKSVFRARRKLGFIRACHGDVHLNNIVLINYQPVLFDAIEFNEAFRWTDIMADLGFLIMDFKDKHCLDYAYRLMSVYLEHTGDYHGLQVLPYYIVYRAMVRAKVSLLRALQPGLSSAEREGLWQTYRDYITLALSEIKLRKPSLMIMHGFSGSGKSTLARFLVGKIGAVQLRSDVERKRLSGIARMVTSRSGLNQGIYRKNMTQRIYRRLVDLTRQVISAGFPVIVDATFLKKVHRDLFFELSNELSVPFVILDCQADRETLETWIKRRLMKRKDPSEATLEVLAMQESTADSLSQVEQKHSLVFSVNDLENPERIFEKLQALPQVGEGRIEGVKIDT